jgi:hypothetical protein
MLRKKYTRMVVDIVVTLTVGTACWFAATAPIQLY